MSPRPPSLNLKTRIAAMVLLLFLGSIWFLTYLATVRLQGATVELLGELQRSAAGYIAAEIEQSVRARFEALETVAGEITPAQLADPESLRRLLAERSVLQVLFKAGVVVIAKDGTGIADYPAVALRSGASFTELEYFRQVMATGKPALGKPRVGRFTKKTGVGFAVPVKDASGAVVAVLTGFSTLADTSMFGPLEHANVGKTGWIAVGAPAYRLIVAASNPSRALQALPAPGREGTPDLFAGGDGSTIAVNSRGAEVLYASKSIPAAGWVVQVALPMAEALAPIAPMKTRAYAITAAVSLVVALVVWLLIRRMLAPLSETTRRIGAMAAGEVELHALPVTRGDEIGRLVASFNRLVAELRQAANRIEFLAYRDALTGLPNRRLAADRMELAMSAADRAKGRAALLLLDLDNFKTINDSLGHPVGDALLKAIAARLGDCVRETDTVSRQGGDEFLVVLTEVRALEALDRVSTHILEQLAAPIEIDGNELSTSVSMGAAIYPDDGRDFDTLLKKADTAMYHAKAAGRNTYRFFDAQMNIAADERLNMRNRLRQALERDEFVLHYQPLIDLASGRVVGAEALIRWHAPDRGLVPPGRFIPVAEECGLIVPIGEWVLREACRQAVEWRVHGGHALSIAVNLSAVQFKRGDLERTVVATLAESGLEPSRLELELTESILIGDTENVLATIRRLKDLGIKLSIDDFGTGYSSLAYLKRFAVDKVKIDQSFVRDLASDPDDAAIVRAIVQMARSLNLRTIAEGVENDAMLGALRAHECDEAQGYHFARPMPAAEFARYLLAVPSCESA